MYDYLADFDFVRSLWEESMEDTTGPARRFAEANVRSSFAISLSTSIRLAAHAELYDEEKVARMLQAFPVVAIDPAVISRSADLLSHSDATLEMAIECALAQVHDLKILTSQPDNFAFLPKLSIVSYLDEK